VKNRRVAAAPRKPRASATMPAHRSTTVATIMFALAIVTMFVAATLALPSHPAPVAAAETQPERPHDSFDLALAAQSESASAAVRPAVAPVVAPRGVGESSGKTGLSNAEKNQIAESATPAAAVAAISEALGKIDSTTTEPLAEPIGDEPAPVSPDSTGPEPVTITGCLEGNANPNQFRLTDTDGIDAPRSRSWRTGFLKKHSMSVALVEPLDPHTLQAQVGQRVAATGRLTSRELRVSSLRTIGPRCD
jgi:hypothetical protein